jgi:hypothetical protein
MRTARHVWISRGQVNFRVGHCLCHFGLVLALLEGGIACRRKVRTVSGR